MGLFRWLIALVAGALYGVFFAQRKGQDLRAELKKSKNPFQTLWQEMTAVDKEARTTIGEYLEGCEDLQRLIADGKDQFNSFVKAATDLGEDAQKEAKQKLESLAKEAQTAASKIGTKVSKK